MAYSHCSVVTAKNGLPSRRWRRQESLVRQGIPLALGRRTHVRWCGAGGARHGVGQALRSRARCPGRWCEHRIAAPLPGPPGGGDYPGHGRVRRRPGVGGRRGRSAAGWLAATCRVPQSSARRRVRLGRALRDLPTAAEAWLAGDIGEAQVGALLGARTPATEEAMERDEEMLVSEAGDMLAGRPPPSPPSAASLPTGTNTPIPTAPRKQPPTSASAVACTCRKVSKACGSVTSCSTPSPVPSCTRR